MYCITVIIRLKIKIVLNIEISKSLIKMITNIKKIIIKKIKSKI